MDKYPAWWVGLIIVQLLWFAWLKGQAMLGEGWWFTRPVF